MLLIPALLFTSSFYSLLFQNETALPFWGEHSLSEQRFFSVACLVYGSNPGSYQDLVGKNFLPLERAEQCEDEYTLAENSWQTLLAPYLK